MHLSISFITNFRYGYFFSAHFQSFNSKFNCSRKWIKLIFRQLQYLKDLLWLQRDFFYFSFLFFKCWEILVNLFEIWNCIRDFNFTIYIIKIRIVISLKMKIYNLCVSKRLPKNRIFYKNVDGSSFK